MADLQKTIDQILDEVLEPRLKEIRGEMAKRLAEELAPAVATPSPAAKPSGPRSDDFEVSAKLNSTLLSIQGGNSQGEILNALLDGAANFAPRVALFVIRAGTATGWQARGFADAAAIKQVTVDPNSGLTGRAVADKEAASAAAAEFSSDLVRICGNPSDGNCVVVPLVVRDKVPALLYADAGVERAGRIDSSGVELLVRSTGFWLELLNARKAGPSASDSGSMAATEHASAAPPPPIHEPERESVPVAAAPPPPPPAAQPAPVAQAASAAAAAPAVDIAPGDEEVHKKAKRFAKLLIDEIKLYNQAKVSEGRKNHDLYDRLRDDIDKSRAAYDKRYASTPAAAADYFSKELVRILAEDNVALLGSNYRH